MLVDAHTSAGSVCGPADYHHQIPRALLYDARVSGLGVATWCRVEQLSLNGAAMMARETMAAEFAVSPATLDRARQVLITLGWLASDQPDRTHTAHQRALRRPQQTGKPYAKVPDWALTHVVNPKTTATRRPAWCPRCYRRTTSERLEFPVAAWRCAECRMAFIAVNADAWRAWAILVDRTDEGNNPFNPHPRVHKWVSAATIASWWKVSPDTVTRRFRTLRAASLVATTPRPGKTTVWRPVLDADDAEQATSLTSRTDEEPTPRTTADPRPAAPTLDREILRALSTTSRTTAEPPPAEVTTYLPQECGPTPRTDDEQDSPSPDTTSLDIPVNSALVAPAVGGGPHRRDESPSTKPPRRRRRRRPRARPRRCPRRLRRQRKHPPHLSPSSRTTPPPRRARRARTSCAVTGWPRSCAPNTPSSPRWPQHPTASPANSSTSSTCSTVSAPECC